MLWAIGICVPWRWAEQLPDALAEMSDRTPAKRPNSELECAPEAHSEGMVSECLELAGWDLKLPT